MDTNSTKEKPTCLTGPIWSYSLFVTPENLVGLIKDYISFSWAAYYLEEGDLPEVKQFRGVGEWSVICQIQSKYTYFGTIVVCPLNSLSSRVIVSYDLPSEECHQDISYELGFLQGLIEQIKYICIPGEEQLTQPVQEQPATVMTKTTTKKARGPRGPNLGTLELVEAVLRALIDDKKKTDTLACHDVGIDCKTFRNNVPNFLDRQLAPDKRAEWETRIIDAGRGYLLKRENREL